MEVKMEYSEETYEFIVRDNCENCGKEGNYPLVIRHGEFLKKRFNCQHCGKFSSFSTKALATYSALYVKHEGLKVKRLEKLQTARSGNESESKTEKRPTIPRFLIIMPFVLTFVVGFRFVLELSRNNVSFITWLYFLVFWLCVLVISFGIVLENQQEVQSKNK